MNAAAPADQFAVPLDQLEIGTRATVSAIDWNGLPEQEGRRLRHLGFDEGVVVEPLHLGPLGRDPIAVRVGRMTVAIRRSQARGIHVVPTDPEAK